MIGPAEDDAWSVRGSDASLAKLAQDLAAPAVKREEDWGGSGGNEEDGEDTDADAFTFRIDMWDANGENIVEHLAGVEDYNLALAELIGISSKTTVGSDAVRFVRVGADRSKGWRIVERSGRFDVE